MKKLTRNSFKKSIKTNADVNEISKKTNTSRSSYHSTSYLEEDNPKKEYNLQIEIADDDEISAELDELNTIKSDLEEYEIDNSSNYILDYRETLKSDTFECFESVGFGQIYLQSNGEFFSNCILCEDENKILNIHELLKHFVEEHAIDYLNPHIAVKMEYCKIVKNKLNKKIEKFTRNPTSSNRKRNHTKSCIINDCSDTENDIKLWEKIFSKENNSLEHTTESYEIDFDDEKNLVEKKCKKESDLEQMFNTEPRFVNNKNTIKGKGLNKDSRKLGNNITESMHTDTVYEVLENIDFDQEKVKGKGLNEVSGKLENNITESVHTKTVYEVLENIDFDEEHSIKESSSHIDDNIFINDSIENSDDINDEFESKEFIEDSDAKFYDRISQPQSLFCTYCDKLAKPLNEHYNLKHPELIFCKISGCYEVFQDMTALNNHSKRFHSDSEYLFTCPTCNHKSRNFTNFRKHCQQKHASGKFHVCKYCEKKFRTNSEKNKHVRTHTEEKPFVCSICNKRFLVDQCLKVHIEKFHSKFQCRICNKVFHKKETMKEHSLSHYEQICEICGESFFTLKELNDHHNKEHRPPIRKIQKPSSYMHICRICGNTLATQRKLREHLRAHSKETEEDIDLY